MQRTERIATDRSANKRSSTVEPPDHNRKGSQKHRPETHSPGIHNRLWRGLRDLVAVRWMRSRALALREMERSERLG